MAKSKAKKQSIHSRAARRATSPSIDTDKALKNAKPPSLSATDLPFTKLSGRSGANTGAGISKRSKNKRQTRDQRLRLEKAMMRAETVMDQMEKKVDVSRRRGKVVKERSGAWEDINGRIDKVPLRQPQKAAEHMLHEDDWEDNEETEGDLAMETVSESQVQLSGPSADVVSKQQEEEEDEVL